MGSGLWARTAPRGASGGVTVLEGALFGDASTEADGTTDSLAAIASARAGKPSADATEESQSHTSKHHHAYTSSS